MDSEVIPVVAIVFVFGIPTGAVVVWMILNYFKRRRLMDLHHAERMAAIERGMDVPPLPIELISGRTSQPRRRRSSLLPGLVWFFVGLAILVSTMSMSHDVPLFGGLIPLGVGLAYLIYYFAEGRSVEARLLEQDLTQRPTQRPVPPPGSTL